MFADRTLGQPALTAWLRDWRREPPGSPAAGNRALFGWHRFAGLEVSVIITTRLGCAAVTRPAGPEVPSGGGGPVSLTEWGGGGRGVEEGSGGGEGVVLLLFPAH